MTVEELLSDETRWCQGTGARDASGNECESQSPHAVCWCIYGAVIKVYGSYSEEGDKVIRKLKEVAVRLGHRPELSLVNDGKGYDAVMSIVREAKV